MKKMDFKPQNRELMKSLAQDFLEEERDYLSNQLHEFLNTWLEDQDVFEYQEEYDGVHEAIMDMIGEVES